jgi:ArsR family metal-binding transcriptional regulator
MSAGPSADGAALWRDYRIVHVVDCILDARKTRVIADLSDDVSPVFPYLNAIMPDLLYNPGARSITLRREWRIITLYQTVAVMVKMDGPEDARAQLDWLRRLINGTWARRAEIEPSFERRTLLRPLDAYLLLPRLNCGACGEATCMAFAFALLLGTARPSACPHLAEPAHEAAGRRLASFLGEPAPG